MEKRDTYTIKEMKMLYYLHRRPCDYASLAKAVGTDEVGINILLSGTRALHICEPPDGYLDIGSVISLTDLGETVVKAEKERRFDMFFTRAISLIALIVSIVAIILETAG